MGASSCMVGERSKPVPIRPMAEETPWQTSVAPHLGVAFSNRRLDPALHVRMDVGVYGFAIPPLRNDQVDATRQLSTSVVDHIERVWAGSGGVAVCIEKFVDTDAENAFAGIPAFDDLLDHPGTQSCLGAYENHYAAFAFHIFIDPGLNRCSTFAFDLFPLVGSADILALQRAYLTDLVGAPEIVAEVKAEKYVPCHLAHPSQYRGQRMYPGT